MSKQQGAVSSWQITIPPGAGRLVDLSQGIFHGAPTYPALPPCEVIPTHHVDPDHMNSTKLIIGTHGTTHLDAPYHFIEGGRTVDQLDLAKCFGPARVIDLTHKGPGSVVEVPDLEPHADIVVAGARILFRFGWDQFYPEARYIQDHPCLTVALCRWLAGRRIALLGMDSPTPNQTDWIDAHTVLLRAEVVIVEALARLDQLPPDREFFFMAAPLKILGRDGAPIRALAMV